MRLSVSPVSDTIREMVAGEVCSGWWWGGLLGRVKYRVMEVVCFVSGGLSEKLSCGKSIRLICVF